MSFVLMKQKIDSLGVVQAPDNFIKNLLPGCFFLYLLDYTFLELHKKMQGTQLNDVSMVVYRRLRFIQIPIIRCVLLNSIYLLYASRETWVLYKIKFHIL